MTRVETSGAASPGRLGGIGSWLLIAAWLIALLIFFDFALGSMVEREPFAAVMAFVFTAVIFALGILVWVLRVLAKRKAAEKPAIAAEAKAEKPVN